MHNKMTEENETTTIFYNDSAILLYILEFYFVKSPDFIH